MKHPPLFSEEGKVIVDVEQIDRTAVSDEPELMSNELY
jgi:hypothetical protein